MELTLNQARVIGCLIEKEITTPEQYPLSLNALMLACNQKSNRDPVISLSESEVQDVVDQLTKKHLLRQESGFGSRVVKYKHRFCNSEFGELQFQDQELGIICVLLLRGPQTPGELRSRTHRLCRFGDAQEVDAVLQRLGEREDGPFVACLPREPGKRESRFAHLFSAEITGAETCSGDVVGGGLSANEQALVVAPMVTATRQTDVDADRLAALEAEVKMLREQMALMKAQLDELFS